MRWLRNAWPSCKLWSIEILFEKYAGPVQVDAVTGACQMVRRGVYESVGGLSTKYFMYSEDLEISAAALAKGWKTYYAGNAEIIHHGGKSSQGSGRGDRWVSIMQRQAMWQFYRTWRGTGYARLYRVTIGTVGAMWTIAVGLGWPVLLVMGKKEAAQRGWNSWTGALQWALGLEKASRKYRGQAGKKDAGTTATSERAGIQEAQAPARMPETRKRCETGKYVLLTAAYNEEENIGKTIESVLAQTQLPERWVIVSDGSFDATDEIVQGYAKQYDLIRFLRITRAPGRSFGSKVIALKHASEILESVSYDFIGNLDADVTLDPTYFRDLLSRFEGDPNLGLAGGFVHEKIGGGFRSRTSNRGYSVAHAAQLVRRECYEEFGGYAVLEYGGEDWHAQISARMNGWEAQAFPELHIYHHRRTGEAENLVRHKFRQGRMDYSFGSDAVFETLKCLERIPEKPLLIGGLARLAGFGWAWASRDGKPVSDEFISFLRSEQRTKLKSLFGRQSPRPHASGAPRVSEDGN